MTSDHGPENRQVHDGPMMTEQLEITAGLPFEGSVAGAFPICGVQGVGYLLHLGHDDCPLFFVGDIAHSIGMEPVEPWVCLILGAHRVVALAVGSHAASDESRHVGDGCAGEQSLGESACVFSIGCCPAAPSTFTHGDKIRAGEHGPVFDGAPPSDGVGPSLLTIVGRGQLSDVIVNEAFIADESGPQDVVGLLDGSGQLLGRHGR